MEGPHCPQCDSQSQWISTLNEWQFYCKNCNVRFNWNRQILYLDFDADAMKFQR